MKRYEGDPGSFGGTTFIPPVDESWREDAACLDMDPHIFYPEPLRDSSALNSNDVEIAKQICRACVAREQCLDYALEFQKDDNGIWGGMTKKERRSYALARINGDLQPIQLKRVS